MVDIDEKTSRALLEWIERLQARHLAELRLPEVGRALRALSSAYVERRHTLVRGSALDSAGKRAAFALFYAPLHFVTTRLIVESLGVSVGPSTIVDVGCGTGAAGAAWAIGAASRVLGLDRHRWAIDEAEWTYRQFGLEGTARHADAARLRLPRGRSGVIAAYVLNELPATVRESTWRVLTDAAVRGPVIVIEPIARSVTPWWDAAASAVVARGGRVDEWRFWVDLPPLLRQLDHSAGLDHSELAARSLFIAPP
jgi:hypothetical protein